MHSYNKVNIWIGKFWFDRLNEKRDWKKLLHLFSPLLFANVLEPFSKYKSIVTVVIRVNPQLALFNINWLYLAGDFHFKRKVWQRIFGFFERNRMRWNSDVKGKNVVYLNQLIDRKLYKYWIRSLMGCSWMKKIYKAVEIHGT